jgi:hypothetical protein
VGGCDGQAAEGLAAWDGATWRPLGSGISYAVEGLAEFRGELVACGGIRTTNPAVATGLLVLRDGSWQRLIPQNVLGGMTSYSNDLILADVGDILGLVRFDGTEQQPIGPQGVFADRPVVLDGDLYCLGYDTIARGYVVDRFDGSEWVQVGGRFGGPVSTLFSHNGRLFVGGQFPHIEDDEFAGAIAVLDGENWVDPDSTVTAQFQPLVVSCAAEFMGQVVIGGEFVVQGADWRPIARWDGTTLSLIETPLPVWPNTMLVVGDELLMAGDGGQIVAWNGNTWRVLGNLGTGVLGYWATVSSMVLSGDDLIIGGSFASVDGHVANLVAKIRYSSCCGSADFNGDGDSGTDQDITAFFACLAGTCCPTCGSVDFNSDGDVGTDQDIEAFFRILSGGSC